MSINFEEFCKALDRTKAIARELDIADFSFDLFEIDERIQDKVNKVLQTGVSVTDAYKKLKKDEEFKELSQKRNYLVLFLDMLKNAS